MSIGNAPENVVACPCNTSGNCFSFEVNGTEICGCFPGYISQLDDQGNQVCTGKYDLKTLN